MRKDFHPNLFIRPWQVDHLKSLMAVLRDAVGTPIPEPAAQYDSAPKQPTNQCWANARSRIWYRRGLIASRACQKLL